jgi:hypothetical protein
MKTFRCGRRVASDSEGRESAHPARGGGHGERAVAAAQLEEASSSSPPYVLESINSAIAAIVSWSVVFDIASFSYLLPPHPLLFR